ncbi:hypothetical protein P8C59_005171 [Phyllachora maydis]|uniref:Uncharacterized protein n=1 Tax=Phyllachora maydis TaxID=1825666 RepID=A0AAD9MD81_9PEZI|nr:hypothetical protein P8C59_005171 [Phyllachora maydis]
MTRQKYKKDFALATDKVGGGDVPNVTNIARGESDGEVIFTIQTSEIGDTVHVHALAQDVCGYPEGNIFMLFTDGFMPRALQRSAKMSRCMMSQKAKMKKTRMP